MSEETESIEIACPHCGQVLVADSSLAGGEVECPTCGKSFCVALPESDDSPEQAATVGEPQPETDIPGKAMPEESPGRPDDVSEADSHSQKRSLRKSAKCLPKAVRVGLSMAWKNVLRPSGCFVLASVWFLLRSIAGLVVKGFHLLKIAPASVRPVWWLKTHMFDPLDARWRRYETARISARSDAGSDAADDLNVPLKRRCAYVVTALAAIAAVFGVCLPESETSAVSGGSSFSRSRSSHSETRSFARNQTEQSKSTRNRLSSVSAESLCDEFFETVSRDAPNYYVRINETSVGFIPEGENPPFKNIVSFSLEGGKGRAMIGQDITFFALEMTGPRQLSSYGSRGPRYSSLPPLIKALDDAFKRQMIMLPSSASPSAKAFLDDEGHLMAKGEIDVEPGNTEDRVTKLWNAMGSARGIVRVN